MTSKVTFMLLRALMFFLHVDLPTELQPWLMFLWTTFVLVDRKYMDFGIKSFIGITVENIVIWMYEKQGQKLSIRT